MAFSAQAAPGKVEVWFLTEAAAKVGRVPELLKRPAFQYSEYTASNDFDANCTPMGDGCFHPQNGFILNEGKSKSLEDEKDAVPESEWKGKVFSSDEVSLVDCKKDYYFDVYCGQERAVKKSATELEMWIDNSASIRGIDVVQGNDICHRRAFAEKVRNNCGGKVEFSVYNNSIKPISELSAICDLQGGNNPERLMKWIKESNAKHLIVITDVDEYSEKFEIFLDSIGGSVRGIGAKPFKAQDLGGLVAEVCK